MSIQPRTDHEIPETTQTLAKKIAPDGNMYMRLRDELGEIFADDQFVSLFSGRGQPAQAPGCLALVTLMQFAEGLSDRQVAEAVRFRIDWKYALGLALDDPGFDYSVLSEFRARLIQGSREQTLLDTLLEHFKKHGWLKARGQQRTDSTHVLAAVRTVNRLMLVGETLRQALNELAQVAPDWLRSIAPTDWWLRYSRRFENMRSPKEKTEREQEAEQIGTDGADLLEAIRQAPLNQSLRALPSVEILRQVWIQQYWTEYLPEGSARIRLRTHPNQPAGEHRINSPYDIEARYGIIRSTEWVGYKTHFTETCETDPQTVHFITHVETTTAPVSDSKMPQRIHTALEAKELLPSEHLLDGGYVTANLRVKAPCDLGIAILGPLQKNTGWQSQAANGYALADFKVDWKAQQVTCPQGQLSKTWQIKKYPYTQELIYVRFEIQTCRVCPTRSQCTRAQSAPRALALQPQPVQEALEQGRQEQETPEFRKQYAKRSGIEGTLSQAIRVCAMRRSRYIGLVKTHLQMVATAAAIDLYRLYDWLIGTPREQTRVSAFAALAPATVSVPKSWRY